MSGDTTRVTKQMVPRATKKLSSDRVLANKGLSKAQPHGKVKVLSPRSGPNTSLFIVVQGFLSYELSAPLFEAL